MPILDNSSRLLVTIVDDKLTMQAEVGGQGNSLGPKLGPSLADKIKTGRAK